MKPAKGERVKSLSSIDSTAKTLSDLMQKVPTHCPECDSPRNCAMEDGKSANLCWCMQETTSGKSDFITHGVCLCRSCLKKENEG